MGTVTAVGTFDDAASGVIVSEVVHYQLIWEQRWGASPESEHSYLLTCLKLFAEKTWNIPNSKYVTEQKSSSNFILAYTYFQQQDTDPEINSHVRAISHFEKCRSPLGYTEYSCFFCVLFTLKRSQELSWSAITCTLNRSQALQRSAKKVTLNRSQALQWLSKNADILHFSAPHWTGSHVTET